MISARGSGSSPGQIAPGWDDFPEECRTEFCKEFLRYGYKVFQRPEIRDEFEQWKKTRVKEKSTQPAKTGNALVLRSGAALIVASSGNDQKGINRSDLSSIASEMKRGN